MRWRGRGSSGAEGSCPRPPRQRLVFSRPQRPPSACAPCSTARARGRWAGTPRAVTPAHPWPRSHGRPLPASPGLSLWDACWVRACPRQGRAVAPVDGPQSPGCPVTAVTARNAWSWGRGGLSCRNGRCWSRTLMAPRPPAAQPCLGDGASAAARCPVPQTLLFRVCSRTVRRGPFERGLTVCVLVNHAFVFALGSLRTLASRPPGAPGGGGHAAWAPGGCFSSFPKNEENRERVVVGARAPSAAAVGCPGRGPRPASPGGPWPGARASCPDVRWDGAWLRVSGLFLPESGLWFSVCGFPVWGFSIRVLTSLRP